MRLLILAILVLTAGHSYGAQCTIIDHGDHYEAVCTGADTAAASQPAQQVSPQGALAEPAVHAGPVASQDPALAADGAAPQMVAQEQDADTREVTLTRSEIGKRHAAYWLAATPRY